jgi:hypothetical protein
MRMPMKPVSRITSRISVNATGLKWFQRFALTAHFTFLFAGKRRLAVIRAVDNKPRKERLRIAAWISSP